MKGGIPMGHGLLAKLADFSAQAKVSMQLWTVYKIDGNDRLYRQQELLENRTIKNLRSVFEEMNVILYMAKCCLHSCSEASMKQFTVVLAFR
jgi:hypothetical protein